MRDVGLPRHGGFIVAATVMGVGLLVGCGSGAGSDRLVGTWLPKKAPTSQLEPSFDPSTATITFRESGRWVASDGCNKLSGSYELSGSKLTSDGDPIGGVGCMGGNLSYDLLLSETRSVKFLHNGTVAFESPSGKELLVLSPQG
jgi:META domain